MRRNRKSKTEGKKKERKVRQNNQRGNEKKNHKDRMIRLSWSRERKECLL
jgi:hypothetical protein